MNVAPNRRFGRRLKVRFRPVGDFKTYPGYTIDISQTGMFISTIRPLRPGTELDVEITIRQHSLHLDAVVVHARKVPPTWQRIYPSGMGMRFLEPADSADGLRQLMGQTGALWN